ncbi:type II toxin-antitoxin system RelE/ParE family toxin [Mobiluncus mulieris]|uniref:type II toxin-antitoxin system RelE/ParE family toxin n=1 Tax=Mobiluncus mulieris TaxID=2052 RepID=UPI001B8BE550|nr:type II toxin-antitoxin system RelE/ParE family toxin [Mobiluncus mulieris]
MTVTAIPDLLRHTIDHRIATRYTKCVIVSFRHAGLRQFYETGSKAGINPAHAEKPSRILSVLDQLHDPAPLLTFPGYRAHKLAGDLEEFWSLRVSGN